MPIKLFVDCHAFDHSLRQGITTYLTGLYQAAVQKESPLEFYFASCRPELLEPLFGTGKNIHYLKYSSQNKYVRLIFEIPRMIRKWGIDYAHYQYISPLWKKCREIVTLHDILFCDFPDQFSWKYRLSKGFLFRRSAKRADILLTVSDYSRDRIIKHWGIAPEKITVTPNAVSPEWGGRAKAAAPIPENFPFRRYLLYVSRIEPRKNHALLLTCYRDLALWKKKIGLVFIGAPAEKDRRLENVLTTLPEEAEPYVRFLGNVDYGDLRKWYAGAELFVFPSVAEGFGIPPLEAGMCGIPCLCSDQTAMSDFDFFGNGLFDPSDPDELRRKLELFFSEGLSLPEPEKIRSEIRKRYDWLNAADVMIQAIERDFYRDKRKS